MIMLKSFIANRAGIIAKSSGVTRFFALGELFCFPTSVVVVAVVVIHAVLVLLEQPLMRIGVNVPNLPMLPTWFVSIFVSAAIGYLTNYIAIQMLYYPVGISDITGVEDSPDESTGGVQVAMVKSRMLLILTLGFWGKGLIPRNKGRIARVLGRIAEEKFVTAENIAYLVPKLSNLFLSKSRNGKIRGVEFVRQLTIAHKDKVANLLRQIGREVVTGNNYQTVRNLLSKIGRNEVVADALSSALFDYMETNPETVVSLVREMVAWFTDAQNRKAMISESIWERLKAGAAGVIVEGVAQIGYPQIRSFLLEYTKKSEHREQFRDRLALLLPLFCDKIAEKIVDSPELLEKAVSGELVLQLIDIDIADDGFWSVIGEKVAPGVCSAICHAVESMSEGEFTQFFSGNRQIADVVERTIINMKLLDFYQMLDDVMAEHLGAIQVFGFILGAAIGYLQYAVFLAGNNCAFVAVMLLAIPVFLVLAVKIVLIVPICR